MSTLPRWVAIMAGFASANSLFVDHAPTSPRPYFIRRDANAQAVAIGQQIYRFPVTGPSSGGAFSLLHTTAPSSESLGVLPHIHARHYENFFCSRGSFQLWAQHVDESQQQARLLMRGDHGAVPQNTTHTFQIMSPLTEMTGMIQPGGFEELFFHLATANFTSSTKALFDPSTNASSESSGSGSPNNTDLESFDVYAQLAFEPRRDLINGSAPQTSWHEDGDEPAANSMTPNFIAADRGPKWLAKKWSFYHIVQPLVTSTQSDGAFAQGTVTVAPLKDAEQVVDISVNGHTAIQVLEGALWFEMSGQTELLFEGDVAFVPSETRFSYWSTAALTRFLYVSEGAEGLDTVLIRGANLYDSAMWPAQ